MNAKIEQAEATSVAEIVKLVLAILLIAAGVAGYYWYNELASWQRLLMLLGGFVCGGTVGYFTRVGRALHDYLRESMFELRKVVWPTRQETVQTTLVIVAVVVILSILLGLIDLFLNWAILQHVLKWGR
jgi:preprotein translocase subunit SecE